MNQQIEEIIKKNLPEKRELKECGKCNSCEMMMACEVLYADRQFNQALSQINTSLIADEVLRVVVEKIKELPVYQEKYKDKSIGSPKIERSDILQLLSNLSLMRIKTMNKIYVFSFRGFYWDYWRNVQTNEIIKFEIGYDPNDYLLTRENKYEKENQDSCKKE